MAIAKRGMLVALINSMSRSEKRFFTNNYQRKGKAREEKFYRLFLHLSHGGTLDDPGFRERLGVKNVSQMANLQRHLYAQLLESLRRQHRRHDTVIKVQEELDYAHLLYERGLYLQALAVVKKAKEQARGLHLDIHHILALEFEKMIQSRHITRSGNTRMLALLTESAQRQAIFNVTSRMADLQLRLQRFFIDHGHVCRPAARQQFQEQFARSFRAEGAEGHSFRERISWFRARFWYHYCLLEVGLAAQYTTAWVVSFDDDPAVRQWDAGLYLKGLDRCLTLAFLQNQAEEHASYADKLRSFMAGLPATLRPPNLAFQGDILHLRARLNQLLLDPSTPVEEDLTKLHRAVVALGGIDRHKKQVLHYKIAILYLRQGDLARALDELLPILDDRQPLRPEVMVYARLLFLFCHYTLGNTALVGYGVNNLTRYLSRVGYASRYPRLALQLLRDLSRGVPPQAAWAAFHTGEAALAQEVVLLRERRYLNLSSLFANGCDFAPAVSPKRNPKT